MKSKLDGAGVSHTNPLSTPDELHRKRKVSHLPSRFYNDPGDQSHGVAYFSQCGFH